MHGQNVVWYFWFRLWLTAQHPLQAQVDVLVYEKKIVLLRYA